MFPFLNPLIVLLNSIGPLLSNIAPVFQSSLPFFEKYWKQCLVGLLVSTLTLTSYEWRHTSDKLNIERAAHAADIKAYKAAQDAANKQAKDLKADLLNKAKDEAIKADKNYSNLLATYRANLLRLQTTQGNIRAASGSGSSNTTQIADGSSTNTEVSSTITITMDDAQICAINTARLQAAHNWAVEIGKTNDQSK
jgi:hypothetical protein